MLGSPWILTLFGAAAILALSVGLSGLAIGLGAIYPRFHVDNASKVAAGFGGIMFMFLGFALLAGVIALSFAPSWGLLHYALDGTWGLGGSSKVLAISCTAGLIISPPVVGCATVWLGAKRLERR
jgi:ABC-2 type transport system permease protein